MSNQSDRQKAELKGLLIYRVGVPCKEGHTTGNYVSTGRCLACAKAQRQPRRKRKGD